MHGLMHAEKQEMVGWFRSVNPRRMPVGRCTWAYSFFLVSALVDFDELLFSYDEFFATVFTTDQTVMDNERWKEVHVIFLLAFGGVMATRVSISIQLLHETH